MKFNILWKPVEKIQIWLQSGSWREDLYTYIVAGDIKSPFKLCLRLKFYEAVTIDERVGTLHEPTAVVCSTCVAYLAKLKMFSLTFITDYFSALSASGSLNKNLYTIT